MIGALVFALSRVFRIRFLMLFDLTYQAHKKNTVFMV